MKNRLSVLSNGDCVSLDNIRSIRIVNKGSRPKVELIYIDGVIFNFDCYGQNDAESLRDEIVAIVNDFEIDVMETKLMEKLELKGSEIISDVKK